MKKNEFLKKSLKPGKYSLFVISSKNVNLIDELEK
jgi:hypothetical protein